MTREEKQKAIDALKISAPVMPVTQEKFMDYVQTLNKIMDLLEQEPMVEIDLDYVIKQKYIEREVLDKIRAEIMSLTDGDTPERIWNVDVLEIIDKYRKEQEDWHGKRSSDEKAYKDFCKDYLKHGAESLVKDHPDLVRDIWNCSSCEHTEDECEDCYPELGYKNNKLKRDTEAVPKFVKSYFFKKLMESFDEQDRADKEDAEHFLRDIKEDNGFFDEIMNDKSEDEETYEKIKEIIAKAKEQEE